MIADDVRQLVRFEVELLHRQPEMIAERLAQMLAPGRRGGELHDAGQIVTTLHACSLCRSEKHTSELQSLMRNSYAVFCLKKINQRHTHLDCYCKTILNT